MSRESVIELLLTIRNLSLENAYKAHHLLMRLRGTDPLDGDNATEKDINLLAAASKKHAEEIKLVWNELSENHIKKKYGILKRIYNYIYGIL